MMHLDWGIQGRGPGNPLIFRPNWGQRAKKIFWETFPPTPYLKVCFRHWFVPFTSTIWSNGIVRKSCLPPQLHNLPLFLSLPPPPDPLHLTGLLPWAARGSATHVFLVNLFLYASVILGSFEFPTVSSSISFALLSLRQQDAIGVCTWASLHHEDVPIFSDPVPLPPIRTLRSDNGDVHENVAEK